jgi:hypothetical protein
LADGLIGFVVCFVRQSFKRSSEWNDIVPGRGGGCAEEDTLRKVLVAQVVPLAFWASPILPQSTRVASKMEQIAAVSQFIPANSILRELTHLRNLRAIGQF